MLGRLRRHDLDQCDCQSLRQIASDDLALDQARQEQPTTPRPRDLGQRLWVFLPTSQTDRARDVGFVSRMLGKRDAEPSSVAIGSTDWLADRHDPRLPCRDCSGGPEPREADLQAEDPQPQSWEATWLIVVAFAAATAGLSLIIWGAGW